MCLSQPKEDNAAGLVARGLVALLPRPSLHPRQQYHLCAVLLSLVFSHMTENQLQKTGFEKLDEMRGKDAKLFEAAVDLLFSIGFDNLTEEMVSEVLEEAKAGFDKDEKSSADDLFVLVAKMLILCAALEIRSYSFPVLLDYIAEKGWRA